MAVTDKATFILNNEYKEQVDMLNDVQAGQLFRAILQYANGQSIDEFADPTVGMMFSFVRQQMDKDYKKYAEVCQKRAEAGRKGGPFDHTLPSFHRHYKENKNILTLMKEVENL